MLVPENVQEQVALDHTMQRLEKERLSADVSNFITKVEVMLKLLPKLEGGT